MGSSSLVDDVVTVYYKGDVVLNTRAVYRPEQIGSTEKTEMKRVWRGTQCSGCKVPETLKEALAVFLAAPAISGSPTYSANFSEEQVNAWRLVMKFMEEE